MGTSYKIAGCETEQLEIDEHSNLFDITAGNYNEVFTVARDLTVEQLANVAFEILKVASYWESSDEFAAWCRARLHEAVVSYGAPTPFKKESR